MLCIEEVLKRFHVTNSFVGIWQVLSDLEIPHIPLIGVAEGHYDDQDNP